MRTWLALFVASLLLLLGASVKYFRSRAPANIPMIWLAAGLTIQGFAQAFLRDTTLWWFVLPVAVACMLVGARGFTQSE